MDADADKKTQSGVVSFPLFTTLSLALAFQHHGQSDTASHGLVC
jgi:hypothetical protein